jgi:hypothetical protein
MCAADAVAHVVSMIRGAGIGSRTRVRSAVAGLALGALLLGGAAARAHPRPAADLEGLWTNVSATPLERPAGLSVLTATDAQAAAYLKLYASDNAADDASGVGGGDSEWWERGTQMLRIDGQFRTSMIVDPADGKLPWSKAGLAAATPLMTTNYDNPERRTASEQCLMGASGSASVPMLPHRSASTYMFVQTPDHLAIWMESGHDPRIIRLKGGARLPANIHPWAGDSIGHWEHRTLVVETTNLNPGEGWKSPLSVYISPDARVTERFTRLSKSEILYGFTVDDPKIYTRPWRGELVLRAIKGPVFEYACHEGNYSLPGILAGARHEEAAAGK